MVETAEKETDLENQSRRSNSLPTGEAERKNKENRGEFYQINNMRKFPRSQT